MRIDPHSVADFDQGRTVALHLNLAVDFERRRLHGSATLTLDRAGTGPLDLDSSGLELEAVTDGDGRPLAHTLSPADPVLGQRLRVLRDRPVDTVRITYRTGPGASALMWLDPAQTHGGVHPFVLTQCQAIHARSIAPLQDTPRARIRYTADLTFPEALSAVMSAAPGERRPGPEPGTATLHFEMPQPIPPYLLALAVGDLASRDLGPRTRVFAEPGVVDGAAWEFADVEGMLDAGEALFGPYAWERFDFVVLPPSFPLGGMENPRMTFLTPTLLAGDRSLVGVLAHELAHSWTGNLVTNADNEHFWLNEGWTVYAERRILERLYGLEAATRDAVLGRADLDREMEALQAAGERTALTWDQRGTDPDEVFSKVPYERGFLLVVALERAVGRERFDAFIRSYLERFRFCSITTQEFVDFVASELPEVELDFDAWLRDDALPADAPTFRSERLEELAALARAWPTSLPPADAGWSTTETLTYLQTLPPIDAVGCVDLEARLALGPTANAELRSAWLALAAAANVPGLEPALLDFLRRVGRTKLVRPVVAAMVSQPALRPLAQAVVAEIGPRLHSSTRGALAALF
ncbi:MAG: leukotriene-A4 hydrolase [Myxococcota bacterium]